MRSFVGTCVNCFNEDGDALDVGLPWSHVSDFALAAETARAMTQGKFREAVAPGAELSRLVFSEGVCYSVCEDGTLLAYDPERDVHMFFA